MQAGWLTGILSRALPLVRDRLLADPRFLFLVVAEMLIDSGMGQVPQLSPATPMLPPTYLLPGPQGVPPWQRCASAALTSGRNLSSTCQTWWWAWSWTWCLWASWRPRSCWVLQPQLAPKEARHPDKRHA